MAGELIHIPVRMYNQQVDYHNLENGPEGPGLYKMEVKLTKLTTDEVVARLREKLGTGVVFDRNERATDPLSKELADYTPEEVRVLGCVENVPHGPHKIWVENPDYPEDVTEDRRYFFRPLPNRYVWETCQGMA